MVTPLNKTLRRELEISGNTYVLTVDEEGMKLAPKGRRKGFEMRWQDFIKGETALAVALNASLANGPKPAGTPRKKARRHQ